MANNGNIDKHVAKFKMLVTQSGLATSAAVMDLFREMLPTPLQKQVMTPQWLWNSGMKSHQIPF